MFLQESERRNPYLNSSGKLRTYGTRIATMKNLPRLADVIGGDEEVTVESSDDDDDLNNEDAHGNPENKEDYEIMQDTNNSMVKIFFRMFLGLLATGIMAYYTYSSGLYLTILSGVSYGVVAVLELVIVLLFSFLFRKLPPIAVTILYYCYAFVNGITLSVIFAAFEIALRQYALHRTSVNLLEPN